jgi:hypothetical protein
LTGLGGRGFVAAEPPVPPHALTASEAVARIPIVLMRILDPALLS